MVQIDVKYGLFFCSSVCELNTSFSAPYVDRTELFAGASLKYFFLFDFVAAQILQI